MTQQPVKFAGVEDIVTQMEAWRSQYGQDRVKALEVEVGDTRVEVVVRAPTSMEFTRTKEQLMKLQDGRMAEGLNAVPKLLMTCLLAPSTEQLAAYIERYPALTDKLGEHLSKMAGTEAQVVERTF